MAGKTAKNGTYSSIIASGCSTGESFTHGLLASRFKVVWSLSDGCPKKRPVNAGRNSEKTEAILFHLREGEMTMAQIARLFGVSRNWVVFIRDRELQNIARMQA